jgi:hypothetical protein
MMLKSSLSVSESAMASMGCSFLRGADLEYRFACRVMAALMLSASWFSRTSCA